LLQRELPVLDLGVAGNKSFFLPIWKSRITLVLFIS
jgi:hypothetical protein